MSSSSIVALAKLASGQEPSAKDLRTLLHADVKSYANDGRLVATWGLRKPEELKAFTNQDERRIKLVADQGLEMAADPSGRALLLFKELVFQPPFSLTFDLKLENHDAAFSVFLTDPDASLEPHPRRD